MIKKIILMCFLLLSLTGCSIEYNLTIDETNEFQENFLINTLDTSYSKESLMAEYKDEYPIFIDEEFKYYAPQEKDEEFTYYDKEYREYDNGYIFRYQAKFNNETYERARTINTAFTRVIYNYNVNEESYYYSFKDCKLLNTNEELENITVNVTFDNVIVMMNNADFINGNVYTWNLTKHNNKEIIFKYKLKNTQNVPDENVPNIEDEEEPTDDKETDSSKDVILAVIALLGFIIILTIIISFKNRNLK